MKKQISLSPGRGLFIFVLCALFFGSISFFAGQVHVYYIAAAGILALIFIDAISIVFFTDPLQVSREMSTSLSLGVETLVKLTVSTANNTNISGKMKIFDIYDSSMICDSMPIISKTKKNGKNGIQTLLFSYKVLPIIRGNWEFKSVEILKSSKMRFWRLKIVHECSTVGKTYPNFSVLAKQQSINAILQHGGEKKTRKRGLGMEFDSLREWQSGDTGRAIDWRATARRKKIIVRQYQEESDQNVLIILDSGFRLHRRDTYSNADATCVTQFDFALNSGLLLAYSALKHGDSVAMQVFGSTEKYVPPRRGINAFSYLMNTLYDVKSSSAPSSPFSALQDALGRLKRRTFIVMISNFRPEDREQMSWILGKIAGRHLLLLVSLRETDAERAAAFDTQTGSMPDTDEALEAYAARIYLKERAALYKQWEHQGLLTIESSTENLSSALIKRYLAVKCSAVL
ncbi:MAG: DUF58 domain-containing protein [Termitinemataceae bacterium]|nr:MAG: DUF58 domain-containing protein [Termitinemataceae bacterium]